MQFEEPEIITVMRAAAASGSAKARAVRVGRHVGDARTLVRDWDALVAEAAELAEENTSLRAIIAKLG